MIKKFYPIFLALFALPFILFSQSIDVKKLEGMKPRNIGPAGMSGRVTAIDVVLSNPEVIYAGTASGGIWRSTGGGIDWAPIFDDAPVQSIGSIKINQRNPSEIWAGTGEGNPRNSQNSGEGIYKTIDGGKTWKLMGLEKTKTIHRIIIHRDNPDIVFAGATGSAWGPNPDRGVFKTSDGGKTWRKVLFVNDSTGCAELVTDPGNPNKLIAAMWEYGRKPWTFNSGGKGSGIYVSFDAGETWEKRTAEDGLPKGILGRCGLAIAPSNPDIVYALVEAEENAFYKSTDGGFKWRKTSTDNNIGNRPFYYFEIYVDPKNENRIYSIHSTLTKSEDGGKTWEPWVGWKVHPDHHALWVSPNDPGYIIEGNDGGLNITHDRGQTWRFAENIPAAQFYHINYDMSVPYRICGGMQDNGTWVGPSSIWKSGGIRNSDWQEVYFGDGFDAAIRPDDGRYCYAMSQGGDLGYIDLETGHTKAIKPVHPDGVELRFNWNAGFAQDPFNPCGIYFSSQFLHKSTDCGDSWEIISPDLTTNDSTKQQQTKSGGLTIDDTEAENYTTIIAIAPSPMDKNVVWVGTDDGNVQVTRDGGKTWTNVAANLTGSNPGSWIPYIEASQKRPSEAFVVVSDYRRNDWRPFVYFTDDYGATFRRIADETQVNGHALSIVQDPQVDSLLWLGTDFGLYFTIDFGKNWNKWTNGFPSVTTTDLKIHPRDNDLIIGTFGRAAWILDDIRPVREIARTHGKVLDEPFKVFPPPTAYLAEYRSVEGTRFAADAIYSGNNRSPMGVITCWIKPPEKKEKPEAGKEEMDKKSKKKEKAAGKKEAVKEAAPKAEEPEVTGSETEKEEDGEEKGRRKLKKDEVLVQVFNEEDDTIRTFTSKVDTGIVRVWWNLRKDGVRFPSRRQPKPGDYPPGGYEVLPGIYKLVLTHDDHRDSTTLTVNDDPRMGFRYEKMKAKHAAYDDFYKIVEKATAGFDRLQDARKTIKLVDNALVNAPDSLKKEISKLGKSLQDSISKLEKRYMMPEGLKGIQSAPNLITSTLWRTSGYIDASDGAPNQTARTMMEKARKDVGNIVNDINRMFEGDFEAYQKKVEAVQFSLFKAFEPRKME